MYRYLNFSFLVLASLICSCHNAGTDSNVARTVEVTTPQSIDSQIINSYPGVVEELSMTKVGFKTAGQISKIYVKEGDHVHKDQLIAQLDTKDYMLGLNNAKIQFDQFKNEFERMTKLYNSGDISKTDYEKAEAGFKQLEIALQNNQNTLDYTTLRAPFEGFVMNVNFKEDEMVDAGTPIVSLMDVSKMEIIVDIPNLDYVQRNSFKSFKCTIGSDSDEYDLTLVSILPKADGNQLYQMKLAFNTKPQNVSAGQNVVVKIYRNNSDNSETSVKIPIHSIFDFEGKKCVWVINQDSTITRTVIDCCDIDSKGDAVVKSGLKFSDKIVKAGSASLTDGEKVHILPQSEKTNIGNLL